MALEFIIDGYNLIRTTPRLARREAQDLEAGRAALLAELAAYKRIGGRSITVVFDAANGPRPSGRTRIFGGIKVIYSAPGQSADQAILSLADRLGSRALVVTADRALARGVESRGATAVDSAEFLERVEMAQAMAAKGAGPEDADDPPPKTGKGPSHKPTKAARQRAARLAKI